MFFPAHVATGYVVGRGVGKWTGIPVAFFSHYVLDWCWNMLYHDEITVPMGLVMGVASALLMWFGREQWPSMLAATITDWERVYSAIAGLDWSGAHYHWTYFWGLPILQNAWLEVEGLEFDATSAGLRSLLNSTLALKAKLYPKRCQHGRIISSNQRVY